MLFNSYQYFIFFGVVVAAFFLLPHRFRWIFLLGASYFYYIYWDPRYAILIMTTTVVVYGTALLMNGRPQRVKKMLVALSVTVNVGILAAIKYYKFFTDSLKDLFTLFGYSYSIPAFNLFEGAYLSFYNGLQGFLSLFGCSYSVPLVGNGIPLLAGIGISFYTFQALSYTIDIYRGTREPERHFGIFALYVSFFPVLLSGPIERSTTLLPQFYKEMEYDYSRVTDGLKLMAWGFFQKLVIADRMGIIISHVQLNPQNFSGFPLLLIIWLFPIYVMVDFSGYTDIAIGAAQVMGYKLMPNFRRPFLALSLSDMWRRWHISLISWFRDYLYIPLGGNRVHPLRLYLNLMIIFTLSGLWHGAQWTFVVWGSLNGLFIVVSRMTQRGRDWLRGTVFDALGRVPAALYIFLAAALVAGAFLARTAGVTVGIGGKIGAVAGGLLLLAFGIMRMRGSAYASFSGQMKRLWMMFWTFNLFAFSGAFFGARNIRDAWYIVTNWAAPNKNAFALLYDPAMFFLMIGLVIFYMVVQYFQEYHGSIRERIRSLPALARWAIYVCLCSSIIMFGVRGYQSFVYFRF